MEGLPFFGALHANILPKLAIVSFLRSLSIIHAVLEKGLSQISSHQIVELYKLTSPKVPLLVADLEMLDAASLPSVAPAISGALDYADEILAGVGDPLSLVGALYVLEGSQNGGITLKHEYARCLNIPDKELSYVGCYGSATVVHWEAFLERLNSLSVEGDQATRVAVSAIRCFENVGKICTALYPHSGKDLRHQVAAINFEAGDHAMPQNPLEIDLALRAGRVAWERYPYLELRYGSRGRRFTNSDSCWLVTLIRAPGQEAVTKALEWLRTVLATRGIPTAILEAHLQAILQTFVMEFPEQIKMPTQFDRFLSNLKAERRALFGASGRSHLIDVFDQRFRACAGFAVESAAELIVSAWVDERSGISGSLSALLSWFTDVGRFSSDWIANVNELLAKLDRVHEQQC
jgi:heme oxygenase